MLTAVKLANSFSAVTTANKAILRDKKTHQQDRSVDFSSYMAHQSFAQRESRQAGGAEQVNLASTTSWNDGLQGQQQRQQLEQSRPNGSQATAAAETRRMPSPKPLLLDRPGETRRLSANMVPRVGLTQLKLNFGKATSEHTRPLLQQEKAPSKKQIWRQKILHASRVADDKALQEYKVSVGFALSPQEQEMYEKILSAWVNRTPSMKAMTSPEDQWGKMKRIELLAIESETEREEEFDRRMNYFGWQYTTTAAYWSQMIKLAEVTGVRPVTLGMRTKAKVLNFLAKEESPSRPTIPLSQEQLLTALQLLPSDLRLGVALAFVLGQRMGDTLRVSVGALEIVDDIATGKSFVSVQYLRGKTTRRRQPFSLHIPYETQLAADLLKLQSEMVAAKQCDGPLFLRSSSGDPETALAKVKDALRAVSPDLCVLSIRRGGLQLMALMGASTQCLLHHSRHSKIELLERYLGYSKLMLGSARERFAWDGPKTAENHEKLTNSFLQALGLTLTESMRGAAILAQ